MNERLGFEFPGRRSPGESTNRQEREVGSRGRNKLVDDDVLSVRREGVRLLNVGARGQALCGPCPVRGLPEKISLRRAAACRREDDSPAVGCPNRPRIRSRIERQPPQRRTLEVEDPDVVLLIANINRHALAVGREASEHIRSRRRRDRLFLPASIDPDQGARRAHAVCGATGDEHQGPVP